MIFRSSLVRVGFVVLFIASVLAISQMEFFIPLRQWFQESISSSSHFVRSVGERMQGWVGGPSRARVEELEQIRQSLLGEIARLQGFATENEALRQALGLKAEGEEGVLIASATAFFQEGRDEYLLLDKGSSAGVTVGDYALNGARVLGGVVTEVSAHSSKALLLTSPSRSTEVLISGKLHAIAKGNNSRELILELIPQSAEIQSGDLVVASPRATGRGVSFLVGEIRSVERAEHEVFKSVRATHLFDPAETTVLILPARL